MCASPTLVSVPARWPAMSRNRWLKVPSGRLYASMRPSTAIAQSLGTSAPVAADRALDQALPCARRFRPRSLPSPGAAANSSVRSRGDAVSTKRFSSAAISSSGVPLPTKPEKAMVSPSRMMAMASAAETILFFIGRGLPPPCVCGCAGVVVGQEEVLDQLDLLVGHQRGRMPAVGNLDGFARDLACAARPRRLHLAHRLREQQVGILAAQDQHRALDMLPDAPERDVQEQRTRELARRSSGRSAAAVASLSSTALCSARWRHCASLKVPNGA